MTKIIHRLKSSQGRDKQLLMNMGVSLLAKGMGILNTFLLVPLYLAYLDKSAYGVWLALASLLTWMRFFEFGLGNGLKNRLTNALSDENYQLGKEYVSTAYFYLFLIIFGFSILWLPLNSYFPWDQLFDEEINASGDVGRLILIVVSAFLANIFFRLFQSVLHAIQATRKADIIGLLNNLGILAGIFTLSKVDPAGGNIIIVGLIAAWLPVLGLIIATLYFFTISKHHLLRAIRPSLTSIKKQHFRTLFGLGIRFFVIQVSMLVIFQSANILILAYYSSNDVVDYHILNRYFSVGYLLTTLILSPLWPAITEAFRKGEIAWVRSRVRMFIYLVTFFTGLMIAQYMFSEELIGLWVRDSVQVDNHLALALMANYILYMFGGVYNVVMNALSRLNIQAVMMGLGALLFYPLFLFFRSTFDLGTEAIVYSMMVANAYVIIGAPVQYYLVILRRVTNE